MIRRSLTSTGYLHVSVLTGVSPERWLQTPIAHRGIPPISTSEDVIVHKLIANRHRDRADIAEILRSGTPLDRSYIERWAKEWEVLERWKDVVAESGE